MNKQLKNFVFDGTEQPVSFIETSQVTDGVTCEVYAFADDETKDLGIIRVSPGKKTPLQRVLKGDKTVEGYVSGNGKLTITKADGSQKIYIAGKEINESAPVTVNIGETMQWESAPESDLVAYEVCFPPYEDGRFENIE